MTASTGASTKRGYRHALPKAGGEDEDHGGAGGDPVDDERRERGRLQELEEQSDHDEGAERRGEHSPQERRHVVVGDAAVPYDLGALEEPGAGDDRQAHQERQARGRRSVELEPAG